MKKKYVRDFLSLKYIVEGLYAQELGAHNIDRLEIERIDDDGMIPQALITVDFRPVKPELAASPHPTGGETE